MKTGPSSVMPVDRLLAGPGRRTHAKWVKLIGSIGFSVILAERDRVRRELAYLDGLLERIEHGEPLVGRLAWETFDERTERLEREQSRLATKALLDHAWAEVAMGRDVDENLSLIFELALVMEDLPVDELLGDEQAGPWPEDTDNA